MARRLYKKLDVNGDGTLTLKDFLDKGISKEKAEAYWGLLASAADDDGDMKVIEAQCPTFPSAALKGGPWALFGCASICLLLEQMQMRTSRTPDQCVRVGKCTVDLLTPAPSSATLHSTAHHPLRPTLQVDQEEFATFLCTKALEQKDAAFPCEVVASSDHNKALPFLRALQASMNKVGCSGSF